MYEQRPASQQQSDKCPETLVSSGRTRAVRATKELVMIVRGTQEQSNRVLALCYATMGRVRRLYPPDSAYAG